MTVGALPLDANGVYLVYGDVATAISGMCTSYCGWHTYGGVSGTTVKFGFIGNSGRCEWVVEGPWVDSASVPRFQGARVVAIVLLLHASPARRYVRVRHPIDGPQRRRSH